VTDFDDDGVTDAADACVEIAAPGTANGCPTRPAALPDSDGDGIPNSADSCPATPAGATDANGDGCPDDPGPGPGPDPGPGPGPSLGPLPDTVAPGLKFSAKAQRALKAKALVWTATSDEACSLVTTVMLAKKRLGGLKRALVGGVATKLKLKLSRKAQGLLRRALTTRRKVSVTLKTGCTDAAGNKRASSPKLVVKR
jgi:hypothetical protein